MSEPEAFWGDDRYSINLTELCKNQSFSPAQVVSSELVYPRGAVPNSQLLWVKVELTNGNRSFVTLPLSMFHTYVQLPQSSIGGWTDGDLGSDYAGLDSRYKDDDSCSSDEARGELQHGSEGASELVET